MILSLTGCNLLPEEEVQEEPELVDAPEPEVTVISAKKDNIRKETASLARVSAVNEENISFNEEGRVQEIFVTYDEWVKKREKLARLDVKDLEYEYQLVKIDLEKLRLKKEKEAQFLEDTVSESDYEKIKLDYDQKKTEYQQLKKSLEEHTIYSPIEGEVVSISMQEDSVVEKESKVITIADPDELELQMNVSQTELDDIDTGLKAEVRIKEKYFKAEVIEIKHSSTENSDPYVVIELKDKSEISQKLDVSEDEILNYGDLLSSTVILKEREDTITIPAAAVRGIEDKPYVRLEKNGKREDVEIKTGIEADNYIEVKDGLKEGDNIILN